MLNVYKKTVMTRCHDGYVPIFEQPLHYGADHNALFRGRQVGNLTYLNDLSQIISQLYGAQRGPHASGAISPSSVIC